MKKKKPMCVRCLSTEQEYGIWVTTKNPPQYYCNKCYFKRCQEEQEKTLTVSLKNPEEDKENIKRLKCKR